MSQKSTKAQQGATIPIHIKFDGGLNYASSPSKIADNELCRALNIIYNSQTGTPETRPGSVCVTAAALPLPIRKLYYYEKSVSEKWLVCVSGLKLYYFDVDHWHEIGTDIIADVNVVPTFITYNTYLLMADGSTNLRKWTGAALSSLSDGLNASVIAEIGARVVINSVVEPDLVTFSGIEDETMWDTADLTNPAVGLRAGFGDNMSVNGFAVFNADLIVSKRGDAEKRLYRINTAEVPANWTCQRLTDNNCSQNAQTMTSAFNNVFFIDTNGFKSLKGVTDYGDLQVDLIGSKVNTEFGTQACDELTYIPTFTSLWYLLIDKVYAYHRIFDVGGVAHHAFTDMQFEQGRIRSILQAGSIVYLAGHNGYLYKLDNSTDTDEVTPAVYENFPTLLLSKRFVFPSGGLLRKTILEMKALETVGTSTAYLRANTIEREGILLKTIDVLTAAIALYDANDDLNDATILLGDMSGMAWVERTLNRVRGTSIQFQIDATEGRFGVEGIQAEVVMVEG